MKNLALAFCSIRPSQYPDNVCDNREKEYLRSLKQLQRVLPKSFDLLVCENTIDDAGQNKNDHLRDFLNHTEMSVQQGVKVIWELQIKEWEILLC